MTTLVWGCLLEIGWLVALAIGCHVVVVKTFPTKEARVGTPIGLVATLLAYWQVTDGFVGPGDFVGGLVAFGQCLGAVALTLGLASRRSWTARRLTVAVVGVGLTTMLALPIVWLVVACYLVGCP
ncbi:MAG: hypothetical protein AAF533_00335 [Acidobacteriota bacterium]